MTSSPLRKLGLLRGLASLFRTYAVPRGSLVLARPFWCEDRHAFVAALPPEWESEREGTSEVVLLEDGQPLGPGGCQHDDIRALGRGRFSHWGAQLIFSSSDNSDPNANGRHYSILPPAGWSGVLPSPPQAEGAKAAPAPGAVDWDLVEVEPGQVTHVGGRTYQIPVPADWESDKEGFSTLLLLEDAEPLPHPHALHGDIAQLGTGRYSHWGACVLFSTGDDSDPRESRHRYAVAHADALHLSHAPSPPEQAGGLAWVLCGLPARWVSDREGSSRVMLLEDGRPLGPAGSLHDDVREMGGGRYSHWGRDLVFSTSDGSDPRTNGRTYTVVHAP